MRTINSALQTHLETGATTVCRCWKIQRSDGVELGFTDHDRALEFDGLVFKASTGMDATALQSATGLSVDNSEALGALTDVGINEADIEAGRYDNADVWQWVVNWQDVAQRVVLFRGSVGEIRRTTDVFEAELRGLSEALNHPIGRSYLKQCSALFGDGHCKFDASQDGYNGVAAVSHIEGRRVFQTLDLDDIDAGWFVGGRLIWEDGPNEGIEGLVRADFFREGRRYIETWEDTLKPAEIGNRFHLFAGCNKQAETCRIKFDNLQNFRGFPHMLGDDWSVAYPSRTDVNDGGSLL